MIRFKECNKAVCRLLAICGDRFTAVAEAKEMLSNGTVSLREFIYIQRKLFSQRLYV